MRSHAYAQTSITKDFGDKKQIQMSHDDANMMFQMPVYAELGMR